MNLPSISKTAAQFLGLYLAAWLCAFLWLVGPQWSLVPQYFVAGWTFSGLELVSFVWLFSLLFYVAILAIWFGVWSLGRRPAANRIQSLDVMPPTLASQHLLELALPNNARVSSQGEAKVLTLDRDTLRVAVTVPVSVLEWWVEVCDVASGVSVKDWCDYEGYDDTPREELDRDMSSDVDLFISRLLERDLRIIKLGRRRVTLEWRIGDVWGQAVPFTADALGAGV